MIRVVHTGKEYTVPFEKHSAFTFTDAADRWVQERIAEIQRILKTIDDFRAQKRRLKSDPVKDKEMAEKTKDDPLAWAHYFLDHYFYTADKDGVLQYSESAEFHREIYRLAKDKSDPEWKNKQGLVCAAPRGHGKSTIISCILPLWWAYTKRRKFMVLVSDTDAQVQILAGAIRAEASENVRLNNAYGQTLSQGLMRGRKGQQLIRSRLTNHDFEIVLKDKSGIVEHKMRIIARGTGGKLRGLRTREQRPDVVVADDIENDQHVSSMEQRNKTNRWLEQVLLPMMDPNIGLFIMIGTVLHFNSVLSRLLEQGPQPEQPWLVRRWSALREDGSPLWAERFTSELLEQRRRGMTELAWMSEYMNDPRDTSSAVFKPEYIRWWKRSEMTKTRLGFWQWHGTLLTIGQAADPALDRLKEVVKGESGSRTGSQFAHCTIGVDSPSDPTAILVLSAAAGDLDFPTQVSTIVNQYKRWKAEKIGVETNGYQLALKQHLKQIDAELPIIEVQHDNDDNKIRRLISFSVLAKRGLVFLREAEDDEPGELDWTGKHRVHQSQITLYRQMVQFPRASHNDLLDTFEMATRVISAGRAFDSWF